MIVKTERLLLRELTEADAPFLLTLMNQTSYHRFIGDRGLRTVEDAADYINKKIAPSYRKDGFGFWLVAIEDAPVGIAGLVKRDELEHPDVGYALLDEFAGRGFAVEAVRGVLALNADKLNIPTLLAITDHDNHRSIRVLEKCGFELLDQRDVYDDGELLKVYQLIP